MKNKYLVLLAFCLPIQLQAAMPANTLLDLIEQNAEEVEYKLNYVDKKESCFYIGKTERLSQWLYETVKNSSDKKTTRKAKRLARKASERGKYCNDTISLFSFITGSGSITDFFKEGRYKRIQKKADKLSKYASSADIQKKASNDLVKANLANLIAQIPLPHRTDEEGGFYIVRWKPGICKLMGQVDADVEVLNFDQGHPALNDMQAILDEVQNEVCINQRDMHKFRREIQKLKEAFAHY